MGGKGHRIGPRLARGAVELDGQVGFDEIGFEKAFLVFELPAFVEQRDKAHAAGIHVKGRAQPDGPTLIEVLD